MYRIKITQMLLKPLFPIPTLYIYLSHLLFPDQSVQYLCSCLELSLLCVALNFKFSLHTSLWFHVSVARLQEHLWKLYEVVSVSLSGAQTSEMLWDMLYLSTNTHPSLFSSACQCNGHSKCVNESICEKCENLTTGKHCETCISGYYGDPTNGGTCQRKWLLKSSPAGVFDVWFSALHSFLYYLHWNYSLIIHFFFPASKAQSLLLQIKDTEIAWWNSFTCAVQD